MATLPGQRTQFTWALNQYNLSDDSDRREHFAPGMAKYIRDALAKSFTVEQGSRVDDCVVSLADRESRTGARCTAGVQHSPGTAKSALASAPLKTGKVAYAGSLKGQIM